MVLQKRYDRMKAKLASIGLVLQGTIGERYIERPSARTEQSNRTGPYYQWTRKKAGRSVTVNLSKVQYKQYQVAIEENRKLEMLLAKMRELSEIILDKTTEGVAKRGQKKK